MKKLTTLSALFVAAALSAGTLEIIGDKLAATVDGQEVKIGQLRDITSENGTLVFGPKAYGVIPVTGSLNEFTLSFDMKVKEFRPIPEGAKRLTNTVLALNAPNATALSFCFNQYPGTAKVLVNATQIYAPGKYAIAQKSNVEIKAGQVYRIKIVRDAAAFTLSIDDKVIGKAEAGETTRTLEKLRLGVGGKEDAPAIELSNLKLTIK